MKNSEPDLRDDDEKLRDLLLESLMHKIWKTKKDVNKLLNFQLIFATLLCANSIFLCILYCLRRA